MRDTMATKVLYVGILTCRCADAVVTSNIEGSALHHALPRNGNVRSFLAPTHVVSILFITRNPTVVRTSDVTCVCVVRSKRIPKTV